VAMTGFASPTSAWVIVIRGSKNSPRFPITTSVLALWTPGSEFMLAISRRGLLPLLREVFSGTLPRLERPPGLRLEQGKHVSSLDVA
jgi:hypothetical protein